MSAKRIQGFTSLKAWLEEHNSYEISVTVSARAALRVQPWYWVQLSPSRADIATDPLLSIWCLLSSAVAGMNPTPEVKNSCGFAAAATELAESASAKSASSSAHAASARVATAVAGGAAAASAAASVASAAFAEEFWAATQADCETLADEGCAWTKPLWQQSAPVQEDWDGTRRSWSVEGSPWAKFAEIYDDFWHGRELDWGYLERIVLIDPKIWGAGPDAIAKAIEIIDMQQQLAAVAKAQFENIQTDHGARLAGGLAGIGHNNPPELLSDEAIGGVWQASADAARALEDLVEELDKTDPSAEQLDDSANRLLKALSIVAKYCGQKLDLAVDTLIKWGIPAGGVWLAANYAELSALANGAKALAKLLGG